MYADFEAITVKVHTCQPPPHSQPKTEVLAEHQACGWAYTVISRHPSYLSVTKHYRGEDAVGTFFKEMMELEETLLPYLKENKPMVLTAEDEAQLLAVQVCYICKHPFTEENRKVRDHDHATGAYRGAAHQTCNRQKQSPSSSTISVAMMVIC